jgi:hypothetical protein
MPAPIELAWEMDGNDDLTWVASDGSSTSVGDSRLCVPSRGWLEGRGPLIDR